MVIAIATVMYALSLKCEWNDSLAKSTVKCCDQMPSSSATHIQVINYSLDVGYSWMCYHCYC